MTNYRLELKNIYPKYSDEDLDEIIKTKEEVKSKIWDIREFMELFKQLTFKKAIEFINFLKKK